MEVMARKYMEEGVKAALRGKNELAEFLLLKSYELDPGAESCYRLGWFYGLHLGNEERGFRYFRRAVRYNPTSGDPYNECGNLLLRNGKVKESVKWFHRSLKCQNNPRKHFSLYNLAVVYRAWNRPERSIRYLNLALRHEPAFHRANRLLLELKNEMLWKERYVSET